MLENTGNTVINIASTTETDTKVNARIVYGMHKKPESFSSSFEKLILSAKICLLILF